MNPRAILTADWHLRPDTPICRTDEFVDTMIEKVKFVLNLSAQYDHIPILIAGDIGNKPHGQMGWPCWLLEWIISLFHNKHIVVIPGQHDLPNHQLDRLDESGLGVLMSCGSVWKSAENYPCGYFDVHPFPYGIEIEHRDSQKRVDGKGMKRNVAMSHQMVIENKPLWPGQNAPKGHALLKKWPCYDLILTGDNHNPFVVEHKGRLLVNPGSLMRQTAEQIDHRPRVYLWDAETNEVEPVYIPINKNAVTRDHIDPKNEKDKRLQAFVRHSKQDMTGEIDFRKNMEIHFDNNRVRKPIKDRVWETIE